MLRRTFIAGSVGVFAAPAAASAPAAATAAPFLTTRVACTHSKLSDGLGEGDVIMLRRVESSFDPSAVGAFSRAGAEIGRLPGVDSRVVARLMEAALRVQARVIRIERGARKTRVALEVSLLLPRSPG